MDNNNQRDFGAPSENKSPDSLKSPSVTPRTDQSLRDGTSQSSRQSSPQSQRSAVSRTQQTARRDNENKSVPSAQSGTRRAADSQNDATRKIDPLQKSNSVELLPDKKKHARRQASASHVDNTLISLIKCVVYITAVLAISAIISLIVIFAANDIYAFSKSDEQVEITIPEGADLGDLADILHDNNVIKYKWLFKMKNKGTTDIKAGEYTVSPSMSYDKLIAEFREKVPTGVSWITIPEGYTTDEIIDLLVESGIGERENYVDVINNYDFDYWFIDELGDDWASDGRIYRLDGYLFPDTYQFYNASSEVTVINKLLTRFKQVFVKSYKERAAELGYTVDEILTLASIIEKEAANQSEFSDVSSVFHNRLNNPESFPCLESDATVVYSIQHETGVRPNLTSEDLNRDDPYNSYKAEGLVPGPIANPSNSAILAALNPKNTNYYYFVSNGKTTYFAATLEEHNANRAKYLAPTESE